ncbi:MAG: hypothetical protein CVU90_08130 [Firmicutes bacterium HGW-Firmicutes-15]|nr:MAG: hypothetical protein CVU90_08130 [Firmicutes bacterium HGW-Firmicutes-15]
MRIIFRKLYRQQALSEEEYSNLMHYAEKLRSSSPESYLLFYERFAAILYRDYNTFIPRFAYGIDDFYDCLLNNPQLTEDLKSNSISIGAFPLYLHDYLEYTYPYGLDNFTILTHLELMKFDNASSLELPEPRQKALVYKYESANPYKETGLKSHFDRIGRYSFVSRLQSIRYLSGSKASEDKIELLSGDCLGGIFTNKEKSIYYYIFLTENNALKAQNACRVLNLALYGSYVEV